VKVKAKRKANSRLAFDLRQLFSAGVIYTRDREYPLPAEPFVGRSISPDGRPKRKVCPQNVEVAAAQGAPNGQLNDPA
jgi:hypothetical protein